MQRQGVFRVDELLRFDNFSHTHKNRTVFNELSLSLNRSEIHAVMSGRSYDLTNFCRLLMGEFDSREYIYLYGKLQEYEKIRASTYAVTTESGLFPEFSIPKNLFINSHLRKHAERVKAAQLFDWLGLELDIKTPVSELSNSLIKLLEIVRGYAHGAPIIVLYDTLFHIDNAMQHLAVSVIQKIASAGVGILYLTSKPEDALRVSNRISIIENGHVLGTYQTAMVRKNPGHMLRMLAGLEDAHSKDVDTLDILEAIVNAREIMDSAGELHSKLMKYAENLLYSMEADACTVTVLDNDGREIAIELPVTDPIPKIVINRISNGFEPIRVYRDVDKLTDRKTLYRQMVCSPVGGSEVSHPLGYIVLGYRAQSDVQPRQQMLLSTFSKDLLITLETSRLKMRSLLLQESNHRIKNNLQMIISLLYMQKSALVQMSDFSKESLNNLINDIVSRIKSIALIHEILTHNGEQNDSIVLLPTIIDGIVAFYKSHNIAIKVYVEQIALKYDKATFIALIVNELLNNCVKHAFVGTDPSKSRVEIRCRDHDTYIEIRTKDNGVGFDGDPKEIMESGSVGMKIVHLAADSLGGTLSFYNDYGATVSVRIPKEGLL